jgi:hypothetical protein
VTRNGKPMKYYNRFTYNMERLECLYEFESATLDLNSFDCYDHCGKDHSFTEIKEMFDIDVKFSFAHLKRAFKSKTGTNVDITKIVFGDKCANLDKSTCTDAAVTTGTFVFGGQN